MVVKISAKNLNCWYGKSHSVKNLNIDVYANEILGIIGPANSGKTTFLRTINRLNDLNNNFRHEGIIEIDKEISRLEKDIQKIKKDYDTTKAKLENENFVSRAPQDVIEKENSKKEEYESKLNKLIKNMEILKNI